MTDRRPELKINDLLINNSHQKNLLLTEVFEEWTSTCFPPALMPSNRVAVLIKLLLLEMSGV